MSETPKQKAIKKAYGECWDQVKDFVDENGWFEYDFYNQNKSKKYKTAFDLVCDKISTTANYAHTHLRPKSIDGISNNNGWLSVKEHGLPKEQFLECFICIDGKPINESVTYMFGADLFQGKSTSVSDKIVSHWMPVIKPLPPPIY